MITEKEEKEMKSFFRFTFVELLIAVAILAILAALFCSLLSNANRTARSTTCMDNLRRIASGLDMYRQENEQNQMPLRVQNPGNPDDLWAGSLCRNYGIEDAVMECPAGVNDGADLWGWGDPTLRFWVQNWQTPGAAGGGLGAPELCGYTVSAYTFADIDTVGYIAYRCDFTNYEKKASEVMQVMDGTSYCLYPEAEEELRLSLISNYKASVRHNGAHWLFFDGHVSLVEFSDHINPLVNPDAEKLYALPEGLSQHERNETQEGDDK